MTAQISAAARRQLDNWPVKARSLFGELLEDAASELQRELLTRALLAGHSPAELHAFADELRGLTDAQAFEACTLEGSTPTDHSVAQLLRAEADPLFAFELKGGTIDPAEDEIPPSAYGAPTVEMSVISPLAPRPAQKSKSTFVGDSHQALPRVKDWGELGSSAPPPAPREAVGSTPGAPKAKFLEDLLVEATRGLSISWKEVDLDTPGGLPLGEALATVAGALARGIPVPCALGGAPGQHRRLALFLQASHAGKSRAFQLYDPLSRELVWANEGDLLAAKELPFENKALRRLTRVVLPQSLRNLSL